MVGGWVLQVLMQSRKVLLCGAAVSSFQIGGELVEQKSAIGAEARSANLADFQELQAGNLSTAQQAYAALQQDFSRYAQVNALPAQSNTSTISLNA
jgi:hypothetical protein